MKPLVKVAIFGTYDSGAAEFAGILHCLGVDMGAPFFADRFESEQLAAMLRRWWTEPKIVASASPQTRRAGLASWLDTRTAHASFVGASHPLLSLCGSDVLAAWGQDTKFVWCERPLNDAIESLHSRGWWANSAEIQDRLHTANVEFFSHVECLRLSSSDMLIEPAACVRRLAHYVGINPTVDQVDTVVRWCLRDNLRDVAPPNEVMNAPIESITAKDFSRPNKIVATILCGNNEGIVEEAVRSVVDWVDEVCLIDTGIHDLSAKRVSAIAREKYAQATFAWCDDFAAARNNALELADQRGATWALTLDTDERMVFQGCKDQTQLRQILDSDSDVRAWLVPCQDGRYSKERFIKIPASVRWTGATHEALNCEHPSNRRILPDCYFWELAKDEQAFEQKLTRDLEILKQTTQNNPLDPRWWYYLGQTYEGLRQWRSAVRALTRCIRLDGWPDESAWACYLAASCLCHLKEYREAEEYCALGMSRKPNAVELPWLASWCCLERGNYEQAIHWAGIAIGINRERCSPRGDDSVAGFRHLPAWFEAPYDVLRFAYRHTNQIKKAEHAERMYQSELLKRQNMFCQHLAGENELSPKSVGANLGSW